MSKKGTHDYQDDPRNASIFIDINGDNAIAGYGDLLRALGAGTEQIAQQLAFFGIQHPTTVAFLDQKGNFIWRMDVSVPSFIGYTQQP